MFERYTQEARLAVFFARKEAGAQGAPSIAGEHLLLGLLREDLGIESACHDVDAARRIRQRIEADCPGGEKLPDSVDMPLGIDCQRVFEEAGNLNHPSIGTEHLLLALLHQDRCLAAQILLEQGFDLLKFRSQPAPLNPSDFTQGRDYV
jgi:ATP-dependent Clp protease ATP-binding subunit ClpC